MARGNPDYGIPDYSFFAVETPVSDIVAERQGFSRLDNRGRVLWFEDWRAGLSRMSADYDTVETQVSHNYENGYGIGYHGKVNLDPLANGGYAAVRSGFMLPVSKRLGLEVGFLLDGQSGQFSVSLEHNYSGTTRKGGILIVQPDAASIGFLAASGYIAFFTPANPIYLQARFVAVKFVVDVSEGKYLRAMVGNTQYDLSSYNLLNGTTGLTGDTYLSLTVDGTSAVNKNAVDIAYLVISGDEP